MKQPRNLLHGKRKLRSRLLCGLLQEKSKGRTIYWFRCNRTGTHKLRDTGKRAMQQQQGTSKINGYCTIYIKAATSKIDDKVTVEACVGQFAPSMKLGHLRIPYQRRQRIAGKLAKGIKIESIFDDLHNNSEDQISRSY